MSRIAWGEWSGRYALLIRRREDEDMKTKTFGVLGFSLALALAFLPPTRLQAFDDVERMYRSQASVALHVSRSDVQVRRGDNQDDDSGNYILLWEARLRDGGRSRGYCEIDPRRQRIIRFESGEYSGRPGRGPRGPLPPGEYPRVRVDTGGSGNFEGGRFRDIRLDRVAVDTTDRPLLVVKGRHDFRLAFYGEVIRSDNPRELTMRITSSDHGDARGRAQIRLNPDRNEIETLDLHGNMDGREMNSSFVRSR